MQRHRFLEQLEQVDWDSTPVAASGFVVCPLFGLPGWAPSSPVQQVYQLALDQARAVVGPSRLERLQTVFPN
jgi:hypothetical protein